MRKLTPIYTMVNFVDDAHFRRVWKHPKKTITTKQRAWVQYMMSVWGRINRGDDSPAGAVNVIGRLMIRTQWNPDMGGHIERMVNWLYSDEGGALRGEELYKKARELVIPQSSTSNIIALAKESDDAAFVEKVMVKLFHRESPVRDYAIKRYCERNCIQHIAQAMSRVTGVDVQQCRRRVVWCEKVFESELFYALQREMEKENELHAT